MLRKRNILPVILMISAGTLCAQNYTIKSYTTSDGLPHNIVRAIARDSTGFLWIGTWDGLSRFDGHEFRNYFHEPDDSTSIPYFSISDICVDRFNNLWINTDTRELVKYNRGTDDFTTIKSMDGIAVKDILNISTDQSGNLIIISRTSIICRDPLSNQLTAYKLTDSNAEPLILENIRHQITFAGDSAIWLTGRNAVSEFRKYGNTGLRFYRNYQMERSLEEPPVHFDAAIWCSVYLSPSGSTWLFSSNGLFRLDEENLIFREYMEALPQGEFSGKDFFYWGKRGDGIYFFNSKDQKLTHIPDNQTKWPAVILPDGQDSFWFSNFTHQGVALGISRVAFIPGHFTNTLITAPDSSSTAVYSVIMDNEKNIWTGIRGFDNILIFRPDNSVSRIDFLPEESHDLSDYIRSMIPVKEGIWIGHYLSLLQFYDYRTRNLTRHSPDAYSFRAIAVDSEGNIITGTDKLLQYNPSSGETEVLWKPDVPGNIFKIFIGPEGTVWAGMSESKLLKYNPLSGESSIIKVTSGTSNIEDIITGEGNDLWIALLGKGVCRYDTVSGAFKYYTTAAGLSNNTTYSLLRDRQGNIWVSTNHGISMIHPETGHVRVFDETDGIAITEFNSRAKFISEDGEFFFGGMGGFVRFYPDNITFSGEESGQRLILTKLEVSGEPRHLDADLNSSDTIIFESGENNFHLSFSSADFINSEKTIFRYRLDPVDRKWTETGPGNRNINYSNLKPGWYGLVIEATDRNGAWTASRQIKVRIKPSFYQTRLFRILIPLLIIGFLVFGVLLYIRQLKQKERSTQDELKLQSLRSQMNPHFIFNSLNSINYFISNNDRLSANRYIADFSRLIRSILSNMGSNFIPLDSEINSLMDYLRIEHLRFSDKFDYSVDISGITGRNETEVCPGIVQPFIENAIWHGMRALEERKGTISIRFLQSGPESLKCIIEDDGVGRKYSLKSRGYNENHKPKGINIVEERLQITGKLRKTNYSLVISDLYPDKTDTGTRVEVDIPARHAKIRTS